MSTDRHDRDRLVEFDRVRAALAAAGLPSADFGRFTSGRHPDVIRPSVFDTAGSVPVLLDLLPTVTHPDVLSAIVDHLASPAARPVAAAPMIALFRDTEEPKNSALKWAIGNAISVVTTAAHIEDLLDLALDPKHGGGRQMIVERLGRIAGDPRVVPALRELSDDPDVALHALAGLRRRLGAAAAVEIIRPLLSHPSKTVRKAAEYNMRKARRSLK